MIVAGYNPETTNLEKTYLSQFIAKGVTSLPVKNNDRFISGRRILVGRMGDEQSELLLAGAINANKLAIAVGASLFDHNADDPVYLLEWDQMRFYRRAGIGGTPTLQTTVDLDVDNADKVTKYDDTTSLSSHYYQTAFFNSITGTESDLSDPIQASGYDILSIGNIIDQVVRRVRDTGYSVLTVDEYLDIANEVGSDLITQAQKPYTFLKKSIALNTISGQNYIDVLAAVPDFWKFDYLEIGFNTGSSTRFSEGTPLSLEGWNQRYNNTPMLKQDNIRDFAQDDITKRIYIYPTPNTSQTGVVILHYFKKFTLLDTAGDLIETPNNLIYRYKLMAEYYAAKSEIDNQWARLSEKYESKYGNEIVKMQRVNRLDAGTPRSMRPPRAYRRRRYTL